jgi:adenine-specific DNA-methyltransferase
MDTKTRKELIELCKERNIRGVSNKSKDELVRLLSPPPAEPENTKVCRLNYIGSKFQLLDWITSHITEKTGWQTLTNKRVADLFAGTGIVSHHFRNLGASVISNDAELYSSVITHAFTCSSYSDACKSALAVLQTELNENKHTGTVGYVTTHYSPHNGNERKFFTIDNAQRIDYIRQRLETLKPSHTIDENMFLLASLLISADAVSNVPAVYGCYLKNFKAKALKRLTLQPIHARTALPTPHSSTHNSDVLNTAFLQSFNADIVYLDPPYNERQYSKNYFPLNIIAKTPAELTTAEPLKGKTGIPTDCFLSPFCRHGATVENAFDTLFQNLNTQWIFLSYNSESTVPKAKMIELMQKYGTVSVVERDYKRFKSFEYNEDKAITEYLFCLHKSS